jgi:GNAT superfamily N-acetyltransferase
VADPLVRLADAADGPAVAALRAAWTQEWHGATSDDGYAERFAAWWASEGARRLTWLAWTDAVPVGMVNLAVFERMPSPGRPPSRWGYLGNAYVRPEWRSRGVGTALLSELLAHARSEGFVRIVLRPSDRSVPFYRRAGFGPATSLLVTQLEPEPRRA